MSTAIIKFTTESDKQELTIASIDNLTEARVGQEYIIKEIETNDSEIKDFLYTLGCYKGETITIISILANNYVISVKDARYSIDSELAETIKI